MALVPPSHGRRHAVERRHRAPHRQHRRHPSALDAATRRLSPHLHPRLRVPHPLPPRHHRATSRPHAGQPRLRALQDRRQPPHRHRHPASSSPSASSPASSATPRPTPCARSAHPRRLSSTSCIAAGGAAGTFFIGIASPLIFSANYDLAISFFVTAALALAVTWHDGWPQRLLWSTASVLLFVFAVMLHTAYARDAIARGPQLLRQPAREADHH